MSRKEVPRAGLLKAVLAGKITNAQGALALHLTVRQFQRLKVRFAAEGARGLLHRLRGRPSPAAPAPSADFILRPRRGPSSARRQRLHASQRRAAEGRRYPPSCPNTRFFTSHGLDRGRAHADPHAPVAPLRPLRTPQPGDDILTEQLA
jgi:hypothetical protein